MAATALAVPAHKPPAPDEACPADAGKKKRARYELEDINNYEVLEEIGEGASGVVAKARHRRTGEIVAVKWIRGHEADDDDGLHAVLREVSCLAAGLGHPGIVQIKSVATDDEPADVWALGCVMAELLAGEPLFTATTEDDMIEEVVNLRDDFVIMGVEAFDGTALDHLSLPGRELLAGLLAYDSEDRLTVADALKHRWFMEEDVEANPPALAAVEAE
ncbi:unnamed protein product [Urochloa decumbens]|uniref:[RNA-polymerase]-subunit kinase n=1 Tax=Urochloa decumbens TaxID=240449 RepID=A0ABC8VCW5_9POAL